MTTFSSIQQYKTQVLHILWKDEWNVCNRIQNEKKTRILAHILYGLRADLIKL